MAVCGPLGLAARRVQRYYERSLARYNLTAGQFLILKELWKEDGIKFKELAERLVIEGSTLTSALDRLERSSYVQRRDDPDDRRSLRVWITTTGWEIRPTAIAAVEALEAQLRGGFSDEDFATFLRVLTALPSHIHDLPAEPRYDS